MRTRDHLQAALVLWFGWMALWNPKPTEPWVPVLGFAGAFAVMAVLSWLWPRRRSLPRYRIRIERRDP